MNIYVCDDDDDDELKMKNLLESFFALPLNLYKHDSAIS